MLPMLKRFALAALAAVGVLAAAKRIGGFKVSPDADRLLNYLAVHKSSPVTELASRLKLPADEVARLLAQLETRGLVQMSGDQGGGHVRIAAITKAGREQTA